MDTYLLYYIVLVAGGRAAELVAMSRSGAPRQPAAREWTAWLVMVPYWLVLIGSAFEHLYLWTVPTVATMAAGMLLFVVSAWLRTRGQLDLGRHFSIYLHADGDSQLVRTGLYASIRHPLYLGTLLFFIACPLFLGVVYSWAFAALGIVGVLVRIELEERFLRAHLAGYVDYQKETAKLVPGLY